MTTLTRDDRTAAILWAVQQRETLIELLEAVESPDRRRLMLGELIRMLRYDAARVTP